MTKESPFQRLLQVLEDYLKGDPTRTPSSFQQDFGLPNATIRNAERQGKPLNEKVLYPKTYANIHKAQPLLNIEWLKTGEGEMWLKSNNTNTGKENHISRANGRPYYNVDFLGGFDLMVNDQTSIPTSYISMEPYNKDGYCWCNLTGDSMSPLIRSGAKICIKHIEDGINGIIYGDVYAIVTNSDIRTVKWVVRSEDDDKIRLVPENKDPKFGDYQDILKSDIRQVFKVELAVNPM